MASNTVLIAAGVTFIGYWIFAYGYYEIRKCNVSLMAIANPYGKSWPPVCNPDNRIAATPPGTTLPTPCTAAQFAAGWVNNSQGQCVKGDTSPTTGYCRDNKTQENMGPAKNGKCPQGQTYSTQLQA